MRVSTQMMFDLGINSIRTQQADLVKLQQQLSTGRRVLTPSDDPIASSRALNVSQAKSLNAQYARNQDAARNNLALAESVLSDVTVNLTDARVTAVHGGNGTLTDVDRSSLAKELRGQFEQLLGLANSNDAGGGYLFAGYRDSAAPFAGSVSGVTYNGDNGARELQVGSARLIPTNFSGEDVFQAIRNGNGVFVASTANANAGTGIIGPGQVTDPAALTGDAYEVRFNVAAGGATTYDIFDTTTSTTLSAGNAYQSGATITFAGMQLDIQGAPANTDVFSVVPSSNQSLFQTLSNLIQALETPAGTPAARARLSNNLSRSVTDLDQALDKLLGARTQAGAWQRELDTLTSFSGDLAPMHETELSELQGLDYAQAISQFTQKTAGLEAAQRTYAEVTRLSLFNFL